jgi:hypothetical protein
MALTKCKECGHEVSKKAEVCPQCGNPLKKKKKSGGSSSFFVLLLIVGGLYFFISSMTDEYTSTKKKADAVSSSAKTVKTTKCGDPDHIIKRVQDGDPKIIADLWKEAKKLPRSDYESNLYTYCILAEGTSDDKQFEQFKAKAVEYANLIKARNKAFDELESACRLVYSSSKDHTGKRLSSRGMQRKGAYGKKGDIYMEFAVRGTNAFGTKVENTLRCIGDKTGKLKDTKIE